ncbi:N-acetyltransferase [Alkalihalophilus pseudofirmus]|uniref:GNAT family N-acetyltransferase n=1 Tax=Alkalihalophilus pseudofirmus TaxID=79885 RepID=UPI000952B753|nr:N-acetyltransferase [Alkalihalophilus pseudofirmus]
MYTGELIMREDQRKEPYHIRRLTLKDMSAILEVQQIVLSTLENKERLQPLSEKEFTVILEGDGVILGVFVKGSLTAFRALWFPGDDEENLGRDLGLSSSEQRKVVHQEISIVHPDYRGNGLQKRLAALVMNELAERTSEYEYVCCTVHPFNIPSLKDKLAQGMRIVKLKEKYAGHLRYILLKKLSVEMMVDNDTKKIVPLDDIVEQNRLLNEGYYGTELVESIEQGGRQSIAFAKGQV